MASFPFIHVATAVIFAFTLIISIDSAKCDKLDQILSRHDAYCGISRSRRASNSSLIIQAKQDDDNNEESNEIGLSARVVGGIAAERFEFPWQISLRRWSVKLKRWYHSCGGVIIDNQWVLTAAHCTMNKNASVQHYMVRIGEHDYSQHEGDERDFNLTKIIGHERFNMYTIEPDISLIKLAEPIELGNDTKFAPICIGKTKSLQQNQNQKQQQQQQQYNNLESIYSDWWYRVNSSESTTKPRCYSSGWGKLSYSEGTFPAILQKVAIDLIDQGECEQAYDGIANITAGMICSGEAGKGTCEGDSGGPLQCLEGDDVNREQNREQIFGQNVSDRRRRWTLHGLTSWAVGCAEERYPSVAARVAVFRDWIAQTIANNN